ncbi:hypothetical protein [Shewanella algae]|uniref:hypothetical protein n=1 Tax=Shewanella algae TaxID=38313 RepID=UPI001BF06F44|nr:hypothetical protein [Shewanella algae]BCV28942.1 hypothetical protein TUM3811_28020 [Shewanella algae]
MENLSQWLNAVETIHESRQLPFKPHALCKLPAHELTQYAVFHAAFLLLGGAITPSQQRLYQFWLPSLSKELQVAEVLTLANEFNAAQLADTLNMLTEQRAQVHWLLDILLFSRLDTAVSAGQKKVLGECAQLLDVEQGLINELIKVSDHILGINKKVKIFCEKDSHLNCLAKSLWKEFSKGIVFDSEEISRKLPLKLFGTCSYERKENFGKSNIALNFEIGDLVFKGDEIISVNENKVSANFSGLIVHKSRAPSLAGTAYSFKSLIF